eukprot:scaffold2911_cov414-Prasinococcus_capsulatus_cf.AAC.12
MPQGTGLSARQIALCDEFVYIAQYGRGTASLNVTVAASVVLHEFAVWAGYQESPREGAKYLLAERPVRRHARVRSPPCLPTACTPPSGPCVRGVTPLLSVGAFCARGARPSRRGSCAPKRTWRASAQSGSALATAAPQAATRSSPSFLSRTTTRRCSLPRTPPSSSAARRLRLEGWSPRWRCVIGEPPDRTCAWGVLLPTPSLASNALRQVTRQAILKLNQKRRIAGGLPTARHPVVVALRVGPLPSPPAVICNAMQRAAHRALVAARNARERASPRRLRPGRRGPVTHPKTGRSSTLCCGASGHRLLRVSSTAARGRRAGPGSSTTRRMSSRPRQEPGRRSLAALPSLEGTSWTSAASCDAAAAVCPSRPRRRKQCGRRRPREPPGPAPRRCLPPPQLGRVPPGRRLG